MSKNASKITGPYDQYDDLQLLQRYLKLREDHRTYYELPAMIDLQSVDTSKASISAEKLDKIIIECYIRGLMGKSKLNEDERREEAKKALTLMKNPSLGEGTPPNRQFIEGHGFVGFAGRPPQIVLKESPYSEVLTDKAEQILRDIK